MNFHSIFIPHDIICLIYDQLDVQEKLSMVKVNRLLKTLFFKPLKQSIFHYINRDYLRFFLLCRYIQYTPCELRELSQYAFKNMPLVSKNKTYRVCDLRFLFELLYKYGCKPFLPFPLEIKYIVRLINLSISWDRRQTLYNICNEPMLQVLHPTFCPINCPTWIPLCLY